MNSKGYFTQYESPNIIIIPTISLCNPPSPKRQKIGNNIIVPLVNNEIFKNEKLNQDLKSEAPCVVENNTKTPAKNVKMEPNHKSVIADRKTDTGLSQTSQKTNSWAANYLESIGMNRKFSIWDHKIPRKNTSQRRDASVKSSDTLTSDLPVKSSCTTNDYTTKRSELKKKSLNDINPKVKPVLEAKEIKKHTKDVKIYPLQSKTKDIKPVLQNKTSDMTKTPNVTHKNNHIQSDNIRKSDNIKSVKPQTEISLSHKNYMANTKKINEVKKSNLNSVTLPKNIKQSERVKVTKVKRYFNGTKLPQGKNLDNKIKNESSEGVSKIDNTSNKLGSKKRKLNTEPNTSVARNIRQVRSDTQSSSSSISNNHKTAIKSPIKKPDQKRKTYKKIKLVINLICNTEPSSFNCTNNSKKGSQSTACAVANVDVSDFLNDFDVDEIVESLNTCDLPCEKDKLHATTSTIDNNVHLNSPLSTQYTQNTQTDITELMRILNGDENDKDVIPRDLNVDTQCSEYSQISYNSKIQCNTSKNLTIPVITKEEKDQIFAKPIENFESSVQVQNDAKTNNKYVTVITKEEKDQIFAKPIENFESSEQVQIDAKTNNKCVTVITKEEKDQIFAKPIESFESSVQVQNDAKTNNKCANGSTNNDCKINVPDGNSNSVIRYTPTESKQIYKISLSDNSRANDNENTVNYSIKCNTKNHNIVTTEEKKQHLVTNNTTEKSKQFNIQCKEFESSDIETNDGHSNKIEVNKKNCDQDINSKELITLKICNEKASKHILSQNQNKNETQERSVTYNETILHKRCLTLKPFDCNESEQSSSAKKLDAKITVCDTTINKENKLEKDECSSEKLLDSSQELKLLDAENVKKSYTLKNNYVPIKIENVNDTENENHDAASEALEYKNENHSNCNSPKLPEQNFEVIVTKPNNAEDTSKNDLKSNKETTFHDKTLLNDNTDANHNRDMSRSGIETIRNLEQILFTYSGSKYSICSIIRYGRYSDIFKCKHPNGKYYALKQIKAQIQPAMGVKKKEMLYSFQNGIPKSNLFTVYLANAFVLNDNKWYFLMEYYPKNLVQAMADKDKPFSLNELQTYAKQLVTAVLILKTNNLVHMDINPNHILINTSMQMLKLCGFDTLCKIDTMRKLPNVGNVNYRPPEIILGYRTGFEVDVWAVALVLFEMAAKRKLFPGIFNNDILYKQICTLGTVPYDMIKKSRFSRFHFTGSTFMRKSGIHGKDILFISQFKRNDLLSGTIYSAYSKSWGRNRTTSEYKMDVDELGVFIKLLKKMLAIHPDKRIPIEFVYSDPFLYHPYSYRK